MSCNCVADWRLEVLDLASGERLGFLPFLGFTFEELLNQVGTATISAPLARVSLADVWPHYRAVAFTRTAGPSASPSAPVCEFIGMIESVTAQSPGEVNIGLVSIEGYLGYRVIASGEYTDPQTNLGAEIVDDVAADGVPLTSSYEFSAINRTITVEATSDMTALAFLQQLTELEDGPDYQRSHTYSGGAWTTDLYFRDYVGNTTPRVLDARRGLSQYGVTVDALQHANWIRGRDQELAVREANDFATTIYPRFDRGVKYSDMIESGTNLVDAVAGELANNRHPMTVPDVTISKLALASEINLGDSLTLNMSNGAIRYAGDVRVVGKAWSLAAESPSLCTLSMVPLDDPSVSVLSLPKPMPSLSGRGCC